jgi:hypothetical protein
MSRVLARGAIFAALVATALPACRAPRQRPAKVTTWSEYRQTFPRVSVDRTKAAAETAAAEIRVVYADERYRRAFERDVEPGTQPTPAAAAKSVIGIGSIKVVRVNGPDHPGALIELRELAARYGASELRGVRHETILGADYCGGSTVLGWVFEAQVFVPSSAAASEDR